MTRVRGDRPLTASAVPASKPPPPTGQMTRSSGPAWSSSSQRGRPLAGDHVPVVEGMNQREPVALDLGGDGRPRARRRSARRARSAHRSPRSPLASPPGPSAASPPSPARRSSWPASATACAWLPEECVITPRRRSASLELQDRVHRPAELERADFLEVLALEEDRAAAPRIERLRGHHGRAMGPGREPLGRLRGCRRSRSGSRRSRRVVLMLMAQATRSARLIAIQYV